MSLPALLEKIRSSFPVPQNLQPQRKNQAAVLVLLFGQKGSVHLLMTKRANHLNLHPGEIAFPGGRFEMGDDDLLSTALRETREEIGLQVDRCSAIGCLKSVHTLTGFEVLPFVAALDRPPKLGPLSNEVDESLVIPLSPLLETYESDARFPQSKEMAVYRFGSHKIWGASAKMVRQIGHLA